MARRKPRKSLELCEKLEVITEVKAGKPIDDVCVQFGISPSKKFLGKILAKKSKILAGGQDLARRLRSCHILGKILAKILARNWPA